ncbi:MAG: hypothetical protein NZ849_11205 [Meiothermus sp.]|uniref:hypothetical protein n=1 Tax=Meiothermus sp. TaxID=1955249 RepID=UPI0025DE2FFA|nr:hypothetical protein [Meiothermus sp.]MCS7058410.1 hypothetical protein [Meiothermus sp.]MCS7195458.1 hypothetical protein [Meiothermus sp.]MDW8481773.1 hypothetical protein [Meiothermus sp.]
MYARLAFAFGHAKIDLMQKLTLSHRYTASNHRFREAVLDSGWLSFQGKSVSIRLYLPLLTRYEQGYQMRDWLLGLSVVSFFVGLASLLLRTLGWLNLPALLRLDPSLLEYGALGLGALALLAYLLFPIRVLYLYDGNASPLLVAGSRKGIEELAQAIWQYLEALRKQP